MSYIQIKVIAETRYFQTVRICGNHILFGEWDPKNGLLLSTNSSAYPEWTHENKIQIDPNFQLEFKCVIQDGDQFIWEDGPNRKHKTDFRRNYFVMKFGQHPMEVRTFQKYEISHEFVQEDLEQARRLENSREYDPFHNDLDSSDNESIPDIIIRQLTDQQVTSIRQLDFDWRDVLKSHFENRFKQKSTQKFRKLTENYASPDLLIDYKRRRSSSQIFTDSYVVCCCFKIPIKIITKQPFLKIESKQDIPIKYKIDVAFDPYFANNYDLFTKRLKLKAFWIGWIGIQNPIEKNEFLFLQQYIYENYSCYGIQIDEVERKLCCFKDWLEPIFSNLIPELSFDAEDQYIQLNQLFAKYVIEAMNCTLFGIQFNHLHSIFIFDYHLYLVPFYLKEALIKKNEQRPRIVTIMRRAFPAQRQYKIIACRQILLSSLLMNDLISFVDLKDLHQFISNVPIQYQKLTRMSGISAFTIEILGRKIILDYGNGGLDQSLYQEKLTFQTDVNTLNNQYLMIGVDSISIYSGLSIKFKIVEQIYLKNHNIQLIQIIYYSNESDFENNKIKFEQLESIYQQIKQINSKYNQEIIKILFNPSTQTVLEYYSLANIYLKTCTRENVSQNYLQYIFVRQHFGRIAKLALSEECQTKIQHLKLSSFFHSQSAEQILNFLYDERPIKLTVTSHNDWLLRLNEHLVYCEDYWLDKQLYDSEKELTLGLKDKQFYTLETAKLILTKNNSLLDNQRVIIINYSELFKQKIQKIEILILALQQLTYELNNTVILISDQECEIIELSFGSINNLYLIAQDGLYIKHNGSTSFQQIVERDEQIETKLKQIALQEQYYLTEKNLIYTLELKEKIEETNEAANIFFQNLIKELKLEFDDYLVYQEKYTIKIKHQYQQIEELLKMIIFQEVNNKGLVSFANIISFEKNMLEKITSIFQHSNMPLNKRFHCVSVSDQIGKNSNLILESTQEIILLLNRYASENN